MAADPNTATINDTITANTITSVEPALGLVDTSSNTENNITSLEANSAISYEDFKNEAQSTLYRESKE